MFDLFTPYFPPYLRIVIVSVVYSYIVYSYISFIFLLFSADEWPPYATYVAIEIAEFIEDSYSDDEDSAPHRLGEYMYV